MVSLGKRCNSCWGARPPDRHRTCTGGDGQATGWNSPASIDKVLHQEIHAGAHVLLKIRHLRRFFVQAEGTVERAHGRSQQDKGDGHRNQKFRQAKPCSLIVHDLIMICSLKTLKVPALGNEEIKATNSYWRAKWPIW